MTNEGKLFTQEPVRRGAGEPVTPTMADKRPFVPPLLTKHGPVAAVTQKNRYAPFFQEAIVAETSP